MTSPFVAFTLVAALLLVFADRFGFWAEAITKMAASTGFVMVAVSAGALDDPYGRAVLFGLACSWVGDLCLLGPDDRWLRAGIFAFLLAHFAYLFAFFGLGPDFVSSGAWLCGLSLFGLGFGSWLRAKVPVELRTAVWVYIGVITCMLAMALGCVSAGASRLVGWGAAAFYLSDLFVAFDRFVGKHLVNRLVGLPLYFVAQLLLALSILAHARA